MRKMMKQVFVLGFLFAFSIGAIAQTRTITGTVADENNEPLIAATVRVPATSIAALTNLDGDFTLEVPEDTEELEVTFTGYGSQLVSIANTSNIQVTLSVDALALDDVVVIGYAPRSRKDLTGAVSSVDFAPLQDVPLPAATVGLQGRTSGVQVTKNSGTPGGGIDIRVRGSTSINASNQPLYIVDGVPIIDDNVDFTQEGVGNAQLSVLADLDPAQIESMEVLKDPATTAIYGSRAANGVVLITTRKGSKGKTKISLNSSVGTQEAIKTIPVVDGPTYIEYITEVFGGNIVGTEANSDWQDLIFRNSIVENYGANISGGTDKTRFFASLGYDNDEGIMVGSRFQRYSGRLNLDHDATEKLKFGMNMGYTSSITDQIQNDNNIFGALSTAILLPPVVPVTNPDGSFGSAFGLENPVAATTRYDNQVDRDKLLGSVFAEYEILDGLKFKSLLGADILNIREDVFEPSVLQSSANGRAVVGQFRNTRIINDNTLTYIKGFGNHNLLFVGGAAFQEDQRDNTFTEAVDFPTDSFQGLTSGAQPLTTAGGFSGDNLQSFYGNIDYNFNSKYYLTASFRADGSSRFINNKWGYFPGVSAAWRVSEEDFLSGGLFDELKVRAAWGQTGNNTVGNFSSRQLFGGGNNYLDTPGTAPTQIGNPDLKWETTTSIGGGIDFALLDSRLAGSLDYYKKTTEDLLLNRPIPTTSGFNSVLQNVGEVENMGYEISLTSINVNKKDFKWSTTFNAGYNENEVTKLVDGVPIDVGFGSRIAEGQPLGNFFGHVTQGIFQNQAEIDAHATQPNAAPGDFRFADISGGAGPDGILGTADDLAPDGVINDADRTFIGNAIPKWTGGLTNNITYKNFDLSGFLQFATGFQIYNNNLAFAEGLNSVFAPTQRAWENRWQEEGDITNIPRLVLGDPNGNRRDSDRYAEDGDYLRLKTLTLAYSLPSDLIDGVGLSRLRLYASGYNIWTATDYSWFDPEVSTFDISNGAPGTDFLTFPQPKSYVLGVNVGF